MSFQSPVEVAGVNNSYFLKTTLNAKEHTTSNLRWMLWSFKTYKKKKLQNLI